MKFTHSIGIKAEPTAVFPWIANPEKALRWQTNVTGGEIIEQTPDMVGTTFRERVEEDGRGTELVGVITQFVENEWIAFHLEGDYNVADVSFRVRPTENGSQVIQEVNVRFKGMLKLFSFFGFAFKKKIQAQIQREFSLLKELCERQF